ncbi:MAG: hypothetical protein KGJ05_08980, partial [Alphaproteobacteria bacterium]|nr:hypothetical protein [Alphaproteobacteria bacterium]
MPILNIDTIDFGPEIMRKINRLLRGKQDVRGAIFGNPENIRSILASRVLKNKRNMMGCAVSAVNAARVYLVFCANINQFIGIDDDIVIADPAYCIDFSQIGDGDGCVLGRFVEQIDNRNHLLTVNPENACHFGAIRGKRGLLDKIKLGKIFERKFARNRANRAAAWGGGASLSATGAPAATVTGRAL